MSDKTSKKASAVETADDQADQQSAILAKRWRSDTFAAIGAAQEAENTTSAFIFERIREAYSIQAAERAFESIEAAWVEANTVKVIQSVGPKAGTEVDIKPAIPASWRTLKSRILKLCKEGPTVALLAAKAEPMLAAQKAMHLSQDELRKMYRLEPVHISDKEVIPALDCRLMEYAGKLADYRRDVENARKFTSKFAPAVVVAGGGNGTGGVEKPLPGPVLTALANLNRAVRDALESGLTQDAVESAVNLLTSDLKQKATAASQKRAQEARDRQRLASIGDIQRAQKADKESKTA